ncbi:MAG TPA: ATP-binding cassette domain-containing protein [Daejeonella sp.]|nr:ATP-binding cassette domain-containing protein [Daejeonella sp.]
MKITLENIGRRFNQEWIFREMNYTFENGLSYAVLGANGSGKSTLLQIISGSLSPSSGKIAYSKSHTPIEVERIFEHLSMAAPYLDLVEEFTLEELVHFHFKFKPYRDELNSEAFIKLLGMERARHKMLKNFSSGMKQRVKLGLACCTNSPILLLDEPTSNLDHQGVDWYLSLMEQYSAGRLLIICSNQPHEYDFCTHQLQISDYK